MEDSEVSQLINVRQFMQCFEWKSTSSAIDNKSTLSKDEFIKSRMEITDTMLEELHNVVGRDTLTCDGESKDVSTLLKNIPDTPLITLSVQKDNLEKRMKYPVKMALRYKYNDSPYKHSLLATAQNLQLDEGMQVTDPEVLLSVRVYKPYITKRVPFRDLMPQQEFHVIGSQILTELRDVIACPTDNAILGEFSETPELPAEITAKDIYKSGFFYIEGVFYNDMRDPNAKDYSQTIIDWASNEERGIGPFASYAMETVRFVDMSVKIGQPYVYVHQGNCEHLIVFTDLRMLHYDECRDASKYPMLITKSAGNKRKCRACLLNNARWVTTESNRSPEDPCFFCETCFKSFHYDVEGNKLGSFKAYRVQ